MSSYEDDEFIENFDDGNHEEYLRERDRILAEFEEKLMEGSSYFGYDEYEWAMLADYASDINNMFLFTEAVFRGLIAFPDSKILWDRRMMLLNEICNPDELANVYKAECSRREPSKIALINNALYELRDRLGADVSDEDAYRMLCDIVFDGEKLTDVEIIEAVKVVDSLNLVRFVADDLQKWEKESFYEEMLWYELFTVAIESRMNDFAELLIEKLTATFPYNSLYWMQKGRVCVCRAMDEPDGPLWKDNAVSKLDDALNAIDTALAINPDDKDAKKIRDKASRVRESFVAESGRVRALASAELIFDENVADVYNQGAFYVSLKENLVSGDKESLEIVSQWVRDELKHSWLYDDVAFRDSDKPFGLSALVETLYITGSYNETDLLLGIIDKEAEADVVTDEIETVRILRSIERGKIVEATEILQRLNNPNNTYFPDCNKLILSIIIQRVAGLHDDADEFCGKLFDIVSSCLLSKDIEMAAVIKTVRPAILHYLLRSTR